LKEFKRRVNKSLKK